MRPFLLKQNLLAEEMTLSEYEKLSGLDIKGKGNTKGICWKVEGTDELNWIPVKEFTAVDVSDPCLRMKHEKTDLVEKVGKAKEFMKTPAFFDLSPKKKDLLEKQVLTMDRYVDILSKRIEMRA